MDPWSTKAKTLTPKDHLLAVLASGATPTPKASSTTTPQAHEDNVIKSPKSADVAVATPVLTSPTPIPTPNKSEAPATTQPQARVQAQGAVRVITTPSIGAPDPDLGSVSALVRARDKNGPEPESEPPSGSILRPNKKTKLEVKFAESVSSPRPDPPVAPNDALGIVRLVSDAPVEDNDDDLEPPLRSHEESRLTKAGSPNPPSVPPGSARNIKMTHTAYRVPSRISYGPPRQRKRPRLSVSPGPASGLLEESVEDLLKALSPLTELDDLESSDENADVDVEGDENEIEDKDEDDEEDKEERPLLALPHAQRLQSSASAPIPRTPLRIRIPARKPSHVQPDESKKSSASCVPASLDKGSDAIAKAGNSSLKPTQHKVGESERQYPCPNPGCWKIYKNKDWLKCHLLPGKCEANMQPPRRISRPRHSPVLWHRCPISNCCKTFKNRPGLDYHLAKGRCVAADGVKVKRPEVLNYSMAPGSFTLGRLAEGQVSGFVDEPIVNIDGCPVHHYLNFRRLASDLDTALQAGGFLHRSASGKSNFSPQLKTALVSDTGEVDIPNVAISRSHRADAKRFQNAHANPPAERNMQSATDLRFAGEFSTVCDPRALSSGNSRVNELSRMAETVMRGLSNMRFARLSVQHSTKDENHAHIICSFDCGLCDAPGHMSPVPPKNTAEFQSRGLRSGAQTAESTTPYGSYPPLVSSLPCAVSGCPLRFHLLSEGWHIPAFTKTASNPYLGLVTDRLGTSPNIAVDSNHAPTSVPPLTLSWNISQLVAFDLGMELGAVTPTDRSPTPTFQMSLKQPLPSTSYSSPVSSESRRLSTSRSSIIRKGSDLNQLSAPSSSSHSCTSKVQVRVTFDYSHPVSGVVGMKSVVLFEHRRSEPPERPPMTPTPRPESSEWRLIPPVSTTNKDPTVIRHPMTSKIRDAAMMPPPPLLPPRRIPPEIGLQLHAPYIGNNKCSPQYAHNPHHFPYYDEHTSSSITDHWASTVPGNGVGKHYLVQSTPASMPFTF